jgi:hypothetical protein
MENARFWGSLEMSQHGVNMNSSAFLFSFLSVKSSWWLEKVQLGWWRGNGWPFLDFG